ncbi:MAG TPA: hypothetical protein VFS21_30960 [Roseiflexaceae bacterium]|nr:hypothetical protein [Roseiflexaceae bacterium]
MLTDERAQDREEAMNWTYDRAHQQWTLRAGPWHASVVLMRDPDTPANGAPQWLALITHRGRPEARWESPLLAWPDEARAWCLTELARLRAREGGQGG